MTTGERNRNPLNVKASSPWRGMTGSDERGHAVFASVVYGLRAGLITLRTYWTRHGLRTLEEITGRWAPSTDTQGSLPGRPRNDPSAYARFLAEGLGVSPCRRLALFHEDGSVRDQVQLSGLVMGMALYENGHGYQFPAEELEAALEMLRG